MFQILPGKQSAIHLSPPYLTKKQVFEYIRVGIVEVGPTWHQDLHYLHGRLSK